MLKYSCVFLLLQTLPNIISMQKNSAVGESDDYVLLRESILKEEKKIFLGGNIDLSAKEQRVNEIILQIKSAELETGYKNVSEYWPSKHFFDAKENIKKSDVFSLIRSLPKGASLHTHMLAAVSVDYIMDNFTYRENLYGGFINGVFKLKFFENGNQTSTWKSLEDYRKEDTNFDIWLKQQLSLVVENMADAYPTVNDIWAKFKKTFTTMYDMVCYRPVFEEYITEVLTELYNDNIMYTELKGTFMPLYELDGTVYSSKDFFKIFINTVENFKKTHPNFTGAKYIHSIYRGVENDVLKDGLESLIEIKKEFPEFIAGFDFVGYEEEGNTLLHYKDVLLNASEYDLKFFFHAGETNWFGHTDLNLVDAMLLNSSRIGHGFALPKHPELIKLGRKKNIPLELCPISNQVLVLLDDHRNHPLTSLLAVDYPIVVCNDDPALWGAEGLSYDWYVTFLAMSPENAGIEFLKQLAVNSINYSTMNESDRKEAFEIWNTQWNLFLDNALTSHNCV